MEIYLTREIDNDSGYIDEVVSQIKAVPDNESLVMLITCVGGDTFQGDRLHRAVLEHKGETKAVVIGLAASMGGVLLSSFDSVELDTDSDIMLHKAHIPNTPENELTPEQNTMIKRFNARAYSRMLENGVNESFLNDVFLSDESKDYWLTAKEAEDLGIGTVSKIERRDSQPFKVAAKIDLNTIKNEYKKMNIFNKTKKVAQMATLADGRNIVFSSEEKEIKVNDTLQVIGSNELLTGKVMLSATMEATIDEENKVTDIEEVKAPTAEVSDEQMAEMQDRMATIEKTLGALLEKLNGDEAETEETEMALEAKKKEVDEATETASALLADALEVAKTIKSAFKVDKIEDKNEMKLSNLTGSEKQAAAMRNVLNAPKTAK